MKNTEHNLKSHNIPYISSAENPCMDAKLSSATTFLQQPSFILILSHPTYPIYLPLRIIVWMQNYRPHPSHLLAAENGCKSPLPFYVEVLPLWAGEDIKLLT